MLLFDAKIVLLFVITNRLGKKCGTKGRKIDAEGVGGRSLCGKRLCFYRKKQKLKTKRKMDEDVLAAI